MKGICPESSTKHDDIERLSWGQFAIARWSKLIVPGDPVCFVDMHAADGIGTTKAQLEMFGSSESLATARLARKLFAEALVWGFQAKLILCDRNPQCRAALGRLAPEAVIVRSHAEITLAGSKYALVLNDPNGPSDQGEESMQRLARECRFADFIINVNIGAVHRIEALSATSINPAGPWYIRNAYRLRTVQKRYEWFNSPEEWARRLGRREVIWRSNTYGSRGMLGRIHLVSNYCQRTPRGYERCALRAA